MDETDDGKSLDGADAGAVPATSTKQLTGMNVHGGKCIPDWYYYTQQEWSRLGLGLLPPERKRPNMGVNQNRRTDESLQEDSDTKT